VGAYLAGLWGLPYDVVETVAYHHSPSDCPSGCFDVLTVVHAAEALLQGLYSECRDQTLSKSLDLEYLKQAGVLDRLPVWTDLMVEQNRRTKEL
jgi:HD-like signal output (HDOD) protein